LNVEVVNTAAADPLDAFIRMTSQLLGLAPHRKGNTTVTFADGRLPVMKSHCERERLDRANAISFENFPAAFFLRIA
jgi:hypothetical protein